MQLVLERSDLKPKFQKGKESVNCSFTEYDHFKPEVQAAIRVVGTARYEELGGKLYNRINVPT